LSPKILKKLRTASLNSEFTGSYKKVYILVISVAYGEQAWLQNKVGLS